MKYKASIKSKKAFLRWCSKGDESYQRVVEYALDAILPILDKADFEWVEKSPDGYKTPHFMIDFERKTERGIEIVGLNFEKYRRYRFKVNSVVLENVPPFKRILGGDLVRYQSELDKAKWWGTSWLSINKEKAFKKEVDKVSKMLPQILDFLSDETAGPNIWKF